MPGIDLIYDITEIFQMHNIETEIIAASVRNPIHVIDCAKAGADIATVPYKVLEQMTKHPLTDQELQNSRQIIRLCLANNDMKMPAPFSLAGLAFFILKQFLLHDPHMLQSACL